ncbi:MAG: FAD-dependent oxidoreductase [Planctomycetes bacterium]|nr:FAD-dependent oxidoreductase [Planctomycetota bacterium]
MPSPAPSGPHEPVRSRPPLLDALVLGAGVHGLCSAFALRRAGLRRITVVEAHGPGHELGGSHGRTRITRSSYDRPRFVQMAREAHARGWPELEAALGRSLRIRTPGLFFGPPGPFDAYVAATLGAGADVEPLPAAAARARFPLLAVDDGEQALLDHTAAMVLAAETMAGLRAWLAEHGVELRWQSPVRHLEVEDDAVVATCGDERLRARCAVAALGAWLPRLLADGGPPLVPLRQSVGYFAVDAPAAQCRAPAFPVWARIAPGDDGFSYGLPDHADAGLKLALHRTVGRADALDATVPPADPQALSRLARERFAVPVRGLRASERCLYAMAPEHEFTIAPAPVSPRLIAVAACSGHGFKFGPVVGRIAAELALAGR